MRKFLVTAEHISEKYACSDLEVVAKEYTDGTDNPPWYVSIRTYGCSKNYKTPEAAIRGMLLDHACFNIKIVPL